MTDLKTNTSIQIVNVNTTLNYLALYLNNLDANA